MRILRQSHDIWAVSILSKTCLSVVNIDTSVAFTNCARVYNESLRTRISQLRSPNDITIVPLLDPDHALDAFVVHALMLDSIRRGEEVRRESPLTLPNKESLQKDRFLDAMRDRNHRYSAYCRPEFNHVCDLCGKEVMRDTGRGEIFAQIFHII
jgi:hypothetical protein